MAVLPRKFGLSDLRAVRTSGKKLAMLTAYDFTTARLMHEAGVPMILVGDSAANVVLGHPTTLPVSLEFMIEITAAVRRAAPQALLMADMPFGSVGESMARSVRNVVKMVQQSGADCVKIEASPRSAPLIARLIDMGVAVVAHLGLRPQSIGVLGAYRYQGRTAAEAIAIVESAEALESAGAAALLLEAVPPAVSAAVVESTNLPIIGCGAGPACHAHVVVTPDLLGLTQSAPRFVPVLDELRSIVQKRFEQYVSAIDDGTYPAPEHQYEMPPAEREAFEHRPTAF